MLSTHLLKRSASIAVLLVGVTGCNTSDKVSTTPRSITPAMQGCAMSHCNPHMDDQGNRRIRQTGKAEILWHDDASSGSAMGLGCSSNLEMAVCSYAGAVDDMNVRGYNAKGEVIFETHLLNEKAWKSAPLMFDDGDILVADDKYLIRFDGRGKVIWRTATTGGDPVSPVITHNGYILLATEGGPLSTYDAQTGERIETLRIVEPKSGRAMMAANTPAVDQNRAYVSLVEDSTEADKTGWLLALDVDECGKMHTHWHHAFKGPSGASPIVFDGKVFIDGTGTEGQGTDNAQVYALTDFGDSYFLEWAKPLSAPVRASFAADPRGGIWMFSDASESELLRVDGQKGNTLERIDIDEMIGFNGEDFTPSSVMTLYNGVEGPVMILGIKHSLPETGLVAAIDLQNHKLLWAVETDSLVASQFPVLAHPDGGTLFVFPSQNEGAYGVLY